MFTFEGVAEGITGDEALGLGVAGLRFGAVAAIGCGVTVSAAAAVVTVVALGLAVGPCWEGAHPIRRPSVNPA